MRRLFFSLCLLLCAGPLAAKGVYLTVPQFVEQSFDDVVPTMRTLWLTPELKAETKTIFGHPYSGLRLRYWQAGARSAWVLEEIGKDLPITIGVVVDGGGESIASVSILEFRESRGGEVRYPFFTEQFRGAQLTEDRRLDRRIDGITGATLSVNAVTKVARLALLLAKSVAASDSAVAGGE